jgi:two-component system, NtrC family, sensor kinase
MSAILIVDDSSAVRTDLGDTLEAAGFRVIPCATLTDARTALRTHSIALVILDVTLPDGDGLELLEQIRRDHVLSDLSVLLLATWDEVSQRVFNLRIDYEDCVGKPYSTERVLGRVRHWLGTPPPRDLVLVVDAAAETRDAVIGALTRAGLPSVAADRGDEGLRLASTSRPTAILVAATMPDMDGPSVIRRLRFEPALRTTPCLVLTTDRGKEAEVRALEAGADGTVQQHDVELIVARIRALLRTAVAAIPTNRVLVPKRVLTVDDDADYLDLLGERLRKRGYEVIPARSGEEALALLAEQPVDCILLDRSMAGMGGVTTCKKIKDTPATRDTPLIFLTATEQRDAVIEGLGAGADDFVSKASGFDVLSARVQAQLRRRQIEDEQRKVREQLLRSELEVSEARVARELAEARGKMAEELARANAELANANRELETFSYTVSHDLRSPLRTIGAFTQALAEELGDRATDRARDYIRRVLAASSRMADLIEALLELSRISRAPIGRHRVDLSAIAATVLEDLARHEPSRAVTTVIAPNLIVAADGRLMRILLDNLLGNAWKFTSRETDARIEMGQDGEAIYIKDNGIGFDMARADRLFTPFYRLGTDEALEGTAIGLATARRIVERHGGRVWAEAVLGEGAKFSFTVPSI